MNLYIRVFILLITGLFKSSLETILTPTRIRLRVLPNDLDINGHMNNGRYPTIMDLGRLDLLMRLGLMRMMWKQKSVPILAALKMRFRLPLHPFEPYDLETQILCWDEKWVFIEQRFVIVKGPKAGAVAAVALVKGGFYNRQTKTTVPTHDLLADLDMETDSPAFPDYISKWMDAEDTLREAL